VNKGFVSAQYDFDQVGERKSVGCSCKYHLGERKSVGCSCKYHCKS